MHEFKVPNMTCGHCASTINLALKLVDPDCENVVDIPGRRIEVNSQEDRQNLMAALVDSGYPPAA